VAGVFGWLFYAMDKGYYLCLQEMVNQADGAVFQGRAEVKTTPALSMIRLQNYWGSPSQVGVPDGKHRRARCYPPTRPIVHIGTPDTPQRYAIP